MYLKVKLCVIRTNYFSPKSATPGLTLKDVVRNFTIVVDDFKDFGVNVFVQGILTEGERSVQLTSSLG